MAKKTNKKLKMNDEVIAQIVKLFQVGLLTGTDVSDQFRTLSLIEKDGELFLDPEFSTNFEESVQKMLDEVESLSQADKGSFKFTGDN